VDQATIELRGLRGAYSRADPSSEKIVLFLTDGQPTLPCRSDDDSAYWSGVCGMNPQTANIRAVLRAAERGRKAGLRFFTFGIGEEALSGPLAIVRLAEITGGSFTPVRDPARLRDVIEQVDFADIEDLTIRNLRNGAAASQVETGADGSFGALVPLEPGRNEIEAIARTSDGQVAKAKVLVNYAPGAPEPPLPPALLASRNQLLELQLADLRRKRLQLEVERTEETRKQLQLEIEKERAQAQNRAESQRKSLDLRVDDRGGQEPPPPKSP
jgi:hypothetical protein